MGCVFNLLCAPLRITKTHVRVRFTDVLLWFLRTYYRWLILFIVPICINTIIKMVLTSYIGKKKVIRRRYLWMLYDLWELMLSCITGTTGMAYKSRSSWQAWPPRLLGARPVALGGG